MGPYGLGDGGQQCRVPSGDFNDRGSIAATLVGGAMGLGAATGAVSGGVYGLGIGAAELWRRVRSFLPLPLGTRPLPVPWLAQC